MLPFFKYLDIPQVPKNLLENFHSIETRAASGPKIEKMREDYNCKFDIVPVKKELENWADLNFKFPKRVFYSIFYELLPMHRHVSTTTSYNYILQQGGEVKTKYQSDDAEIVENMLLEKWYWINTSLLHGTIGKMNCSRIILMVTPVNL